VGAVVSGLLVGIVPVGGDPDQMYRPIKSELARALKQGKLPFWSDRLGLGVPLLAESHAAALYPLNLLLYRLLDVDPAYRFSMWLHYLGLVAAGYGYARVFNISAWGSALAALSFALCGFQASHAGHEPFYHVLPYLLASLLLAERYLASGAFRFLVLLALCFGVELTLGHYQLQMWTGGLVLLTAAWRTAGDRRLWSRAVGLAGSLVWGAAIAAVPLALSWELLRFTSTENRPITEYTFYSFPPAHWAELVIPRLFRSFLDGAEDRYWVDQQSSPLEACLYIGTLPLILAFVGWNRHERALAPWRFLVVVGFALATMPRWWSAGYAALLRVPGLGSFRAPARYSMLTSLGLCLLAGHGLDAAGSERQFRRGVAAAVLFCIAGAVWAVWLALQPEFRNRTFEASLPPVLISAGLAWAVALAAVLAWCKRSTGPSVLLLISAVELGLLYYSGSTTWGRSVNLGAASRVLASLVKQAGPVRIAGYLRNVPLSAGLTPAFPYLGFRNLAPHPLLEPAQTRELAADSAAARRLRRFGVTAGIWDAPFDRYFRRDAKPIQSATAAPGVARGPTLYEGPDPVLDRVVPNAVERKSQQWTVVVDRSAFAPARVALRVREAPGPAELVQGIDSSDAIDEVWFLAADRPKEKSTTRASHAGLRRWDGETGEVACDGVCDLVVTRTYYPGWTASVNGGPDQPVLRAEGGLQAIRLSGPGVFRVSVHYRPTGLLGSASISMIATSLALGALLVTLIRASRRSV
jgi:hypothetical protein